jgi:hypothetical protein
MGPSYEKDLLAFRECWYGEGFHLVRYTLPDGRKLVTFIQAEPWSSGPYTFLALKDEATGEPLAESLWTDQEIAEATGEVFTRADDECYTQEVEKGLQHQKDRIAVLNSLPKE